MYRWLARFVSGRSGLEGAKGAWMSRQRMECVQLAAAFGHGPWTSDFPRSLASHNPFRFARSKNAKNKLTALRQYINLSASVDITVSCRVAEGLARGRHGNR